MAFIHYRDLDVFKLAYQLALEVHRGSEHFPKTELYGGMADQMRRASKSICANIAEGLGKGGSVIEQRRFLGMGMGSAEEMRVWSMFCKDLGYIDAKTFVRWDDEYLRVNKMLFALMERRKGKK